MSRLLAMLGRQALALFVDNAGLALAALGWIAVVGLLLPPAGIGAATRGTLLFGGLALALAVSCRR